ncbi:MULTISPECIES: restriction endonuclease subunit S [Bacillus]|uniref:restriction endonuclease subunit S n=1 Tax=Bacillus TaxID=1386 RepID=UPI0001A19599|nr:restriction endonuclease subunit S [Bacillus pseudomycoides]EEM13839.1 hypothetical protein bpmyx0001_53020 [Bacillus pseudomycoides DSM 12442]MED1594130.1 restriction endonuclease subunit S [Bacillus pseudomycoides]MED4712167.1 restriction endonuclease subunit S [Bacillus pseudomycoides]OOR50868.1 hypothetical protein BLX05_16810 [Bacillus pseudomycoides]PDY14548.1 restriction endonuclease subunit S [Bacillus pseudomycoides]
MNVPKLRFPNFNDKWSSIKLDELLEFNNGINADKNSYGKGRKFINVLDILNNEHIVYENIKGSVEVDAKTENNNKVEYGDILFLRSSETREDVGKCSVYLDEKEYCLFGGFVIRGKKIAEYEPYFLKLNLETPLIRHQIGSKSGGSTRFNVSQSILSSVEIKIPSINEQKKISKFMDLFNKKIQLQQQKIDLLQEQKKGFLQKMFPKAGEKQPQVRFAGFTDDWEQREFGEIITERREKTKIENEDTLLSSAIDGMYLNSELFSHFRGASNIGYLKIRKNDMILSAQNLHLGNCNINQRFEHGIISPAYKVYSLVNVDAAFMHAWIKKDSTKQFFEKATTEGASVCRKNIEWGTLYSQKIYIPIYSEQQKIGELFNVLDKRIQLQQQKLELLQKQKKGFMQQMFI